MSYTALYRKFRPREFEDVKGQEHIVTTLKNQRKKYIPGRQDSPTQSFTYNYTETNYFTKVKPYCDGNVHEFLVVFPDGTSTYIKGKATTYKNAVSLNSAVEATLVITTEEIDDKNSNETEALLPEQV